MNSARVRCNGCNRSFAPRGLSQHIQKTRNVRCRLKYRVPQDHVVSLLASIPRPTTCTNTSGDNRMEDTFNDNVDQDDVIEAEAFEDTFNVSAVQPDCPDTMDLDAELFEDPFNDDVDQVDAMDAEAFEMLLQTSPLPEQQFIDEPPSPAVLEDPDEPPSSIGMALASGTASQLERQVIIERFPIGHASAPIPEPRKTSATNKPSHVASEESIWGPFHSQCDWAVARWVKMRGSTSSAASELLAIPEV